MGPPCWWTRTAQPLRDSGRPPGTQASPVPTAPRPHRAPPEALASVCSPVKWDCAHVRGGRSRAPPPGVAPPRSRGPRPESQLASFHHPLASSCSCQHLLTACNSPPTDSWSRGAGRTWGWACGGGSGRGEGSLQGCCGGAGEAAGSTSPPSLLGPSGGGARSICRPHPQLPHGILTCFPAGPSGAHTAEGTNKSRDPSPQGAGEPVPTSSLAVQPAGCPSGRAKPSLSFLLKQGL